jgi:molecular chaperone HtpG
MSTPKKGNIRVNTQDIFPIIKKWLYSEHDIFLRELVANATDAITKRATLSRLENSEAPAGKITIEIDEETKTLTLQDNGLGMTEEEVEKYIAQLAFSGAEEFVNKMKDQGGEGPKDIIGKFGLGFYSVFMVADKVQLESLSMKEGAKAVTWECEGQTDYTFSSSELTDVGTRITLYLNEDGLEFAKDYKVRETLRRYCDFLPYPITIETLAAKKERLEKAPEEQTLTPINDTVPLWKRDPKELTDEDYKDFYRHLYPMEQEPLFWIHLKVDHPFTLEGILYFPKLNPSKPVQEQAIKLYCKQVFVSDNLKGILPDFLGLLKGALDSHDIPLNVSRSSLQGDPNVKKISNYVVKKVAEALKKLASNEREKYESIWSDIGLFVKYGCVSDDKFDDLAREYVLFPNSAKKWVTLTEYRAHMDTLSEELKTKTENKIIYFEKGKTDQSLVTALLEQNVWAIETDEPLDPHFIQHAESRPQKDHKWTFVGVDSEFENLCAHEAVSADDMKIKDLFTELLPSAKIEDQMNKTEIEVKGIQSSTPAYFKVDEQMKRFERMAKSMGNNGMSFPVKKTLVINPHHPLIKNAMKFKETNGRQELASKICQHVEDLAMISSVGLSEEGKEQFIKRNLALVSELSQNAL